MLYTVVLQPQLTADLQQMRVRSVTAAPELRRQRIKEFTQDCGI